MFRGTTTRIAATSLAVLALLAIASPASAHDELVGSSPAEGEAWETAPEQIELIFSAEVLDVGSEIIVTDEDGTDWVDGDIVIDFDTVTVPLSPDMPDGAYSVAWRVVSEDGHPISGLIPFTVGDVTPTTETTASATPTESSTTDGDGIPPLIIIGVSGAVAAAALFALGLYLTRRHNARIAGQGPSDDGPKTS